MAYYYPLKHPQRTIVSQLDSNLAIENIKEVDDGSIDGNQTVGEERAKPGQFACG